MLLLLNNLVVLLPLSFNYQQFLLFFGDAFFIIMLLFLLLDIANPKLEIIPSQKLTSFTLKLNNRVQNIMLLTFSIILINVIPYKSFFLYNVVDLQKTTYWLFFDKVAIDFYTSSIKLLILFSSILILKFSHGFIIEIHKISNNLELPLLIGFATFFLLLLTSTMDLIVLGLTMEGLSLTLYVLININLN
jgi:NADH:ubiquinone oxidoreductase subunit 2 (subunit N)